MSNVSPSEIVGCVASAFSVSRSKLLEHRKNGRPELAVSQARGAVLLLINRHTMASRRDIAEVFNRTAGPDWHHYCRIALDYAVHLSVSDPAYARRLEAAERLIDSIHDRRAEFPVMEMHEDHNGVAA
jgi:hypothetical protein